jgi:hypothetical protein
VCAATPEFLHWRHFCIPPASYPDALTENLNLALPLHSGDDIRMSQAERDAIDIFWLLYPMLDEGQKDTSEGRRAAELAERYRSFSLDSGKLEGYDRMVRIIRDQLKLERRDPRKPATTEAVHPARAEAYESIVRMLSISHELDDIRFDDPPPAAPVPQSRSKKRARKSAAKKSSPRPGTR